MNLNNPRRRKYVGFIYELSPREQRKQVRRWRYHRQYQRKRLGDSWGMQWIFEQETYLSRGEKP